MGHLQFAEVPALSILKTCSTFETYCHMKFFDMISQFSSTNYFEQVPTCWETRDTKTEITLKFDAKLFSNKSSECSHVNASFVFTLKYSKDSSDVYIVLMHVLKTSMFP